jgi:NitT/TauT family transport system permease protein
MVSVPWVITTFGSGASRQLVAMTPGAGLCVIGALVADFFFTRGDLGLGRLMNNYAQELQYERLFGGVILASLLGVTIYALIGWIGNRVMRDWHESEAPAA